jgi:flagellum-specific peptidoglycan hydrolase FlgJ
VHTPLLPKMLTTETSNTQLEQSGIRDSGLGFRIPNPDPQAPISDFRFPDFDSPIAYARRLTPQQLQFFLRVVPAALQSERDFEIPACITIAQSILESATAAGWGSSSLFRLANNPFGIKYCHFAPKSAVHSPQSNHPAHQAPLLTKEGSQDPGPQACDYGCFDAATWEIENGQRKEIIAQFQRFPNLAEAFRAHALLLRTAHYRPAFEVRHDWKQFAERLGPKVSRFDSGHCGYSTNPSYSAALVNLVNLYRLNDPRMVRWLATGKDPGAGIKV